MIEILQTLAVMALLLVLFTGFMKQYDIDIPFPPKNIWQWIGLLLAIVLFSFWWKGF